MRFPFLTDLSVGQRLAFGFTSMVVMLAAVAGLNALEFRNIGERLRQIVEVNNPKIDLANRLLNHINELSVEARNIALLTDVKEAEAEVALLKRAQQDYQTDQKALQASIEASNGSPREQALIAELATSAGKTMPMVLRAAKEGEDGANTEATMTLMMLVRPNESTWRKKVSDLIALEGETSHAAYRRAQDDQTRAMTTALGVLLAAALIGSLVGWRITRSVKRPIDDAMRVAERIAEGDLSSTVVAGSTDEIGRLVTAISRMQDRLRSLVGQIRASAESIQRASMEVSAGNLDLSQRTELAAANLQRAASSMDQLTTTMHQSADAASQANKLAASASLVASRGGQVVSEVVATMDEINTSSQRIADIIAVIDGIAFQTNILALNAAVEAARAGEQGRGFAVVANEVRSLAARCATAAKEIKALIGTSVDKVAAGARLVDDAGATMSEIVASVRSVSDIIAEITAASLEQSSGIDQINSSVSELDQMTQQNAALVEQSAAAAASLLQQATDLTGVVSTFRLRDEA